MFNRILKISSSTGEQRWINLDRVTRISMATDSAGDAVLVFCFDGQDHVKLHGCDNETRALIRKLMAMLDASAESAWMKCAA
jgi:hypothetical protein